MRPYLIGIAGPSCSGKSCVAAHLALRLDAAVLSLDSYYRPLDHLSPQQRDAHNFDVPDALDFDLLLEHLRHLQQGRAVRCPVYDFAAQTRTTQISELAPRPFMIIEGLFALYWDAVRACLGTKIYVELDDELCRERRIVRDVRYRGRSHEGVLRQYSATVAPMAKQYVYPSRAHADLLISGNAPGIDTPGESDFSRQIELILHHARASAQSIHNSSAKHSL